jgi:hypothetical protein
MNKMISGAYGVELTYIGSNKIYFPDVAQLRNKRIKHIDFCTMSKTPSGKTCVGTTDTFLTVMELNTNKELIINLPISKLSVNGNRLFVNKIFDFQRSYIEYKGSASIANKAFYAVIWYDEPAVWNIINETNQRTKILPLQIKIAGLKTHFAENLQFKNEKIVSLFLSIPSYTPEGSAVCSLFTNKFITLAYKGLQYFHQVPLYLFDQSTNYYPIRMQGLVIDLQSSFIESLDTNVADLKVVFFNAVIDDSVNLKR